MTTKKTRKILLNEYAKVIQWYRYCPDWVDNYLVYNAVDYNGTKEENWHRFVGLLKELGYEVLVDYLLDVGQEEELKDCLYYIETHDIIITEWDENGEYDREGLDD